MKLHPSDLPVRRLLCAVIEQAYIDADSPYWKDRDTVRAWIGERVQPYKPRVLSFVWCCQILGLDEGCIKERVLLVLAVKEERDALRVVSCRRKHRRTRILQLAQ